MAHAILESKKKIKKSIYFKATTANVANPNGTLLDCRTAMVILLDFLLLERHAGLGGGTHGTVYPVSLVDQWAFNNVNFHRYQHISDVVTFLQL